MTAARSPKAYTLEQNQILSSAELAAKIAATDFSGCAVTVVGYGNMGRQYVKALQALRVKRIRVCSRSPGPLEELQGVAGLETIAGGFERLEFHPQPGELGIVTTPTLLLVAPAERLASLGFQRLLIEKPVSLWASEIERLAQSLERQGVKAACAYNRVAYPSFHEVCSRAVQESGITSCTYTFTEMVRPDWPQRFPAEELARWGIANSLHVIAMAHGLIGLPKEWSAYRCGSLLWHPSGATFVGAGRSERGIPFSFHADWGSTGRWSVEIHTSVSSYRLCPLEKLFRRASSTAEWQEVPIESFAPDAKAGFVEQLAAMLHRELQRHVPLVPLTRAAALTRYAEDILGYSNTRS